MFQSILRNYWPRVQHTPSTPLTHHTASVQEIMAPKIFHVTHASELRHALIRAEPDDTIIICRSGNYGEIHIHNKQNLVIRGKNKSIVIQGFIVISGDSQRIKLACLTLWHPAGDPLHHALISSQQETKAISIDECILSSLPHCYRVLGTASGIGTTQQWVNGIALLGTQHQMIQNQLTHLQNGLIVYATACNIQHNTVQFFIHTAITLANSKIWVSDNTIYNPILRQSKPSYAILLQHPSEQPLNQLSIGHNTIKQHSPNRPLASEQSNHLQGILNSNTKIALQNCHIHNNQLTLNPVDAFIFGANDKVLLDNNVILI